MWQKKIQTLCRYYSGASKTSKWKENGVQKEKTTSPLINPKKSLKEWGLFKRVVPQCPRDCMWHLINKYHFNDFPSLITLAQLALTSAAHTASCERAFCPKQHRSSPAKSPDSCCSAQIDKSQAWTRQGLF